MKNKIYKGIQNSKIHLLGKKKDNCICDDFSCVQTIQFYLHIPNLFFKLQLGILGYLLCGANNYERK